MPRYFFKVQDGQDIEDDTGMELPGLDAARDAAMKYSGELLLDKGAAFWREPEWTLEVSDETRRVLLVLRFSAEPVETTPEPARDVSAMALSR